MDDLQEYKLRKLEDWKRKAIAEETFPETAFCFDYSSLLADGGHLDDPEILDDAHRDTNRGTRIDGWSWNENEGIITVIVCDFEENDNVLTISKSEIETIGNRATKFLEIAERGSLDHLDPASSGYQTAQSLKHCMGEDNLVRFRIAVLTSKSMSARTQRGLSKKDQKFKLKREIADKECLVEIYDLKRFKDIEESGDVAEPVNVNFDDIGGPLKALPANAGEQLVDSYLCIMPGETLSNLYDEYGQRLLESNVRTFLQFGGKVNRGIRETLLVNPENFFSYNNGLTVTGKNIQTKVTNNGLEITHIEDMQIVNGGQTSSAIYFAPKEKGKISSGQEWKNIDLSKVFVQMKLSIIKEDEDANEMKEKIANFANSQNAVNAADLASNHPFHRKLEEISRRVIMPAGERVIPSKWYYERARGQYQTEKRKKRTPGKIKDFELEYPKSQLFNKTDMAKFENTWRMNPHEVKQGAAKNFLAMSNRLSSEFEQNPDRFADQFFKDLVAKAIWFKDSDREIGKANWYVNDRGLKAETSTYSLALMRHILKKEDKDINLKKIYENQKISEGMKSQILLLAEFVRNKMRDDNFRDGMANISEFCKRKTTWEKYQNLPYELDELDRSDWLNAEEQKDYLKESKETNKAGKQIDVFEKILAVDPEKWHHLSLFKKDQGYKESDAEVSLPKLMNLVVTNKAKKIPTDKQFLKALNILEEAEENGFTYI